MKDMVLHFFADHLNTLYTPIKLKMDVREMTYDHGCYQTVQALIERGADVLLGTRKSMCTLPLGQITRDSGLFGFCCVFRNYNTKSSLTWTQKMDRPGHDGHLRNGRAFFE